MSFSFSEKLQTLLEQAGWTAKRKVDLSSLLPLLQNEGYAVSSPLQSFLESFDQLIWPIPAYALRNELDECKFNANEAIAQIDRHQVDLYEQVVKENLIPIGLVYRDHMVLLLSTTGKIYGGFDQLLVKFGNSIEESLEAIYFGKESKTTERIDLRDLEFSLYQPSMISVVVDRRTHQTYKGMSGSAFHIEDQEELYELWPWYHCAEFAAVNEALHQGAKLQDLVVSTLRVKSGAKIPRCRNCEHTINQVYNTYYIYKRDSKVRKIWEKLF